MSAFEINCPVHGRRAVTRIYSTAGSCPECRGADLLTQPPKPPAMGRPHSTFRLSPIAKRLLARLAKRDGATRTAVLERLIRDAARRAGMTVR